MTLTRAALERYLWPWRELRRLRSELKSARENQRYLYAEIYKMDPHWAMKRTLETWMLNPRNQAVLENIKAPE